MSLLSRFRRTVVPMSSSRKKANTDDGRLYNYRKPTKSFNEKSVKTRNSPSYTDSHGDGTTTTGYQYHHPHHHHHRHQQQHRTQFTTMLEIICHKCHRAQIVEKSALSAVYSTFDIGSCMKNKNS